MLRLSSTIILLLVCTSTLGSDLFELSKSEQPDKELIKASMSSSMISFQIGTTSHGGTVSISGPDGIFMTEAFEGQSTTINLLNSLKKLPPGRYTYTIKAHVGNLRLVQDTIDNGRGEDNFTYAGTPISHSGSFVVNSGSIQSFSQIKEASNNDEW
ncbi:hypothetical protein [Planctobacterium marinum]|uniref:hypothetical protein n=1 Tax=Planctobacterium marinum TaxID=1631968 RepID=UPI001E5817C5|nr:hypothetical protein [Planctobacterium marinum]MCC2606113.1 hypothetical protein [Planctobacterium marinum]